MFNTLLGFLAQYCATVIDYFVLKITVAMSLFFLLNLDYFLLCLWVFSLNYIYSWCHRGQKSKALDPLELKLQMAVSHHVGVGTGTQVLSARAAVLSGAEPSFQPFSAWVFKVVFLHISRRGRDSNTGSLSKVIQWSVLMTKLIYVFENLSKPREESKNGHLSRCHSDISNTVNILFIIFLLWVMKCFY